MTRIAIIGNGIAGITTARHIRKLSNHAVTVISAESEFFYSRTALMYIYMGHMTFDQTKPYEDWFWNRNRIRLKQAYVSRIDIPEKKLVLENHEEVPYEKLVIATGSKTNKFNWPGQDLEGVQGLYSLHDLQKMERNTRNVKRAVIVGGGLIGVEMAEMLRTRHIEVTFLVMEPHYWGNILPKEEGELVGRHMAEHGVTVRYRTLLKEILPDDGGRVRAVRTDQGEELPCQFVGLTAGVHPNIDLVRGSGIDTDRGVLVNQFLETNVPDIYAAGDCAQIVGEDGQSRVEQLWYTGRLQGEALAKTICGEPTAYERGVWFNSAKFFDIEYQTYGFVAQEPREGERSLYWEHADGNKCVRLVYRDRDGVLVGANSFGIRYRHRVFEHWLQEGKTIQHVLRNLRDANFDPELFRRFEPEIVAEHNRNRIGPPVALNPT